MKPVLLEDISLGTKFVTTVSQRIFLNNCLKYKICPPEIRSLASRMLSNRNYKPNYIMEVYITKLRISTAGKEIREIQTKWNKAMTLDNLAEIILR